MLLKVFLAIPPKYGTYYPPLGTPALSGYLKSRGVEVKQVDWNIEYHSFLNSETRSQRNTGHYSHLLPDKPVYELPYEDNTYSSFCFTERLLASPLLFRFINDAEENLYHRFILEKNLINEIINSKAGILGISIISPSQVIFSFTLGYLLKQSTSGIHVVIGGQWVSLYRKELLERKDFGEFFDSAIFFEGETPLLRLVHELSNYGDLSNVPNLIYKKGPDFVLSDSHSVEILDELPCPDFDGLPLTKYSAFSEEKVSLTFETSRECYWNKCVYCVDLPHPKQGYRVKNPRLAVTNIKELLKRYPQIDFSMSDPAMSPNQMLGISKEILKENLNPSWWCFARLDKHFTRDIFELAKKAGCRAVAFGMETANQRLLDLVQKGINLNTAKKILRDCHAAGIDVHLQMMLGIPTETKEEALETITFLVENRDIIEMAIFNIYYLTPGCLLYEDPVRYGIIPQKDPLPFQFFIEFSKNGNGISRKEGYSLVRLYNILMEKYVR